MKYITFEELLDEIETVAPKVTLTDKAQRALYGVSLIGSKPERPRHVTALNDMQAITLALGQRHRPELIRVKQIFTQDAPRIYRFTSGGGLAIVGMA